MVKPRAPQDRSDERIQLGQGPDPVRPARPGGMTAVPAVYKPRLPTLSQLAGLMVNGLLRLPRNYRRGMFLDILA